MSTLNRTLIILLGALLVAIGVWALSQTAWAVAFADGVIAANQARMDAAYAITAAAGRAGGGYIATAGNLARIIGIAGLVIGMSLLMEQRKKRRPKAAYCKP